MSGYPDNVRDSRRLAVLFALYLAAGYRSGERPLRDVVAGQFGFAASLDALRADLVFLAETGLITRDGATAILTADGEEVVLGRKVMDGVRRPAPGELER